MQNSYFKKIIPLFFLIFTFLLRNEGILTQVHYMPVTSHPYYKSLGYETCNYKNSVDYYNKCLSLPLYYSLTNDDQSKVIKLLKSLLN